MVIGCQTYAPAAFTPRDIPGTHSHYGLSRPQGHGLVGRKHVTEKSSDNNGNRSRDRPTSRSRDRFPVLSLCKYTNMIAVDTSPPILFYITCVYLKYKGDCGRNGTEELL